MRLTNKITIKGDTLSIFESIQQYNDLKVGDMVTIDDSIPLNAITKAGLQPKTPYEIKFFINQENNSVLAVFDPQLARKTNYMQGVFNIKYLKNTKVTEGSFNPMKGEKRNLHLVPLFSSRDKKGYMLYKSKENPDLIFAEKNGILYDTDEMGNPTTSIRMSLFNVSGLVKEEVSDNSVDRFIRAIELYKEAARNNTHTAELEKVFKGGKLTSAFIVNSIKSSVSESNYNNLVKMFGKSKVDNLVNIILSILETSNAITMENINVNEHQGSLMINGKFVKTYTQNGDKSYNVVYDDGTKDIIMVSHNDWDSINKLHHNSINESKKSKNDPAEKKKAEKTNYGQKDISDVDMVNPYELKKGIRIEMVDIDDYEKAMDKAVKKLKKDPMFYSNLISNNKVESKRSDVPVEIKDKKLNKVSDKLKDKANEMEVSKKDVAKKNANDSLNKKEKASGKPKGVKEMTMTPKKAKGMKSMEVPGKEKKTKLKESFNLWEAFKKNILR